MVKYTIKPVFFFFVKNVETKILLIVPALVGILSLLGYRLYNYIV